MQLCPCKGFCVITHSKPFYPSPTPPLPLWGFWDSHLVRVNNLVRNLIPVFLILYQQGQSKNALTLWHSITTVLWKMFFFRPSWRDHLWCFSLSVPGQTSEYLLVLASSCWEELAWVTSCYGTQYTLDILSSGESVSMIISVLTL